MTSTEEGKRDRLIDAVNRNNTELVAQIIADDVTDLNLKTEGGWTALMFATSHGYLQIVQMLVDAGADPWMLNRQNQDCEYIARKKGFNDILAVLLTKE